MHMLSDYKLYDILFLLMIVNLFILINSYIIYPFLIILFSLFRKKENEVDYQPSVSVLISAYNEEKVIAKRVENIINCDYDLSRLEILIGSDCSNDSTNEILKSLKEKYENINIFLFEKRRGKAAVINDLVNFAKNEILFFTDANTHFEKDAIKNLVKDFVDEKTGGVCGNLRLTDDSEIRKQGVEEAKYWALESKLKKAEGKLGIVIGANGGIFAIRKKIYDTIPLDKAVTDDFFISLTVLKKGYGFTYCNQAIAQEEVGKNYIAEYKRKVRFISTNLQTITYFYNLLFNKNLLLSYAFWSHKIARWFLPLQLIILLITSIFLISYSPVFLYIFVVQIIFYFLGIIGYFLMKIKKRIPVFSLPFFFLMTNVALLAGIFRFLRGKHSIIWQSTER